MNVLLINTYSRKLNMYMRGLKFSQISISMYISVFSAYELIIHYDIHKLAPASS